MKIPQLIFLLCLSLTFPACHTARWAAHGAVDESEHTVQKTGHVLEHGAEKVDRHL